MSRGLLAGLVTAALACAMAPAVAMAQQDGTATETVFTPTLFVLASHSNNEYRSVSTPVADSSLFTELELPFVFRGPRWNGGFSVNPAWRKYQELEELDQLETSVSGWADGRLSRRTSVRLVVAGVYSPQMNALDGPDIITPRVRRLHSRGQVKLKHSLSAAGDAIDLEAEYDGLDYLESNFVSQQTFGVRASYAKAVSKRASVSIGGGVSRTRYDNGGWVNSATPTLGFTYRMAPRTELAVRGGVSFSQLSGSTLAPDSELALPATQRQTIAFEADLEHRGEHSSFSLAADRRVGSGVALGEPTIRSQVSGHYGYQHGRFLIGLSAGIAINELLVQDGSALLLTSDGLMVTTATEIRTVTSCVNLAFRAADWMSVVASGRIGKQLPTGAPDELELDIYRVAVGVALHPRAPRSASAAGAKVLDRYGRAGSLGSC